MNSTKPHYDHSLLKVDFPNRLPVSNDKIRVICSLHDVFTIRYYNYINGAICPFCQGRNPNNYWTKKKCIEDARKYQIRSEWKKASQTAYFTANKNGWLEECCKHMIALKRPNGYWTKERCIQDAKKYRVKNDWFKKRNHIYNIARTNGWLKECCQHMVQKHSNGYWTKKRCIEDAKKYNKPAEWIKNTPSAYHIAARNGWLKECCKHMVYIPHGYWTKKRCIEEAKKYRTKKAWKRSSQGSYSRAYKSGWLEECSKHMVDTRLKWTKTKCIQEASRFYSNTQWANSSGSSYNAARRYGWLKECSKHLKKR